MQIAYEKPNVRIGWDAELSYVYMEWRGVAFGEDFRAALERYLQLQMEKGSIKQLVNLEKCRIVRKEDQEWMEQDWIPRVRAAGMKYVAFMVPRSELAKASLVKTVPQDGLGQNLRFFDNEEDARTWLGSLK